MDLPKPKTEALSLPAAMPVKTVAVAVVDGRDRGSSWEGEEAVLGTAPDSSLVLHDETVSGYHVRLVSTADGILVSDLGSTNGTFAGEVRIRECVVPLGTSLRLGRTNIALTRGMPTSVDLHDEDHLGPLRGRTPPMRRLMSQIRRAAQSSVPVLLVGESGTGKELLARALHDSSPRVQAPFVTIDCGAITPSLIASELFGHEKGAFTGATHAKVGAFEAAHGGTVFLDEIGELPAELQSNLLGALERRRFCRVGGRREITVDVRVVAATNRELRADVNAGRFRLDLYYRLAVVALEVPPLRDRAKDIPLLVEHFAREEGWSRSLAELVPDSTMAHLVAARWPGNVRELRNYVQALVAMGEAPFPDDGGARADASSGDLRNSFSSLLDRRYNEARTALLREFESCYLEELMRRSKGNVAAAAREADMARSHLNELLRRHRIR